MSEIKLQHKTLAGRKVFISPQYQIQCAYCLDVQPTTMLRDNSGLIIGLTVNDFKWVHHAGCPQEGQQ